MTGRPTGDSAIPSSPSKEAKLNLRALSPKDFAAELEQRAPEVEAAVARIEAAKTIGQEILDMEISI